MSTPVTFPTSPIPEITAGGSSKPIQTAACLIIGDEILNGKTHDSNSNYFAKYCFELGIDLKRIEVIADDEAEIVEASTRMVKNYDFVITSGGIGPTHDDITYQSLAKAFGQDLKYHEETKRRMWEMSKHRDDIKNQSEDQKKARDRMAYFPADAEVLFVDESLWVPVVRLEKKLCILPGVPKIYTRLLEGLKPYLVVPSSTERQLRMLVRTSLPESSIAPYLTSLAERMGKEGIKVGSYPKFQSSVTVSLLGKDHARVQEVADEVCKELQGKVVESDDVE